MSGIYTHKITVRFSASELEKIIDQKNNSACRSLSAYLRKKAMDRPMTIYTRDRSLDAAAEELVRLRKQIQAIGNNFNQAVHRLHMSDRDAEVLVWLTVHEKDFVYTRQMMKAIFEQMEKFAEVWLRV